jgi:hypothetical protein
MLGQWLDTLTQEEVIMPSSKPGESGYLQTLGVRLKLVQSIDDLYEFKRWAGEKREVMGVDTETSGFSPERDKIRLIQFGDEFTGWAIPWEGWGGGALEILRTYTGPLVLHN